jgi:hypothetical protein
MNLENFEKLEVLGDSNVKPRIASKEDVQRDQAVRIRLARVEQLANENYSIDEIAYLTGEPKFRIETDMEKVRARRREHEKQNEYARDMLLGSSSSNGFGSVIF